MPGKEAAWMHSIITKYSLSEFTKFEREPILRVAPKSAGNSPLARFRSPVLEKYPANQPLVLSFLGQKLDSPDVLRVKSSRMQGQNIMLDLEHLDYVGDIAKNIVTRPVVEVDLGSLAAGAYHIRVTVNVWEFKTYDKPTTDNLGNTQSYDFSFSTQSDSP